MVTQLQDVSNTVAQEKISNQRLRNEEIRRQMANPWSKPKEPTTSGTQPLQDVTKGTPTLASTYSGLLNNYRGMTGTSSNSGQTENNYNQKPYTGNPNPLGIPGWASTVVGTGLSLANAGIAAPLGSAATSLLSGDKAGAVGTLGGLFTNIATKGSVPGLAGVVSSLASGLVKGKSATEMAKDAAWSFGKSALTKAVPGLGLADILMGLGTWGVGALTGKDMNWNPRRGLNNLFGDGLVGVAPGFAGYGGGFFGNNALGSGIKSTEANIANSGYSSGGSSSSGGYTPSGFSSGDLGSGITRGSSGSGISGGGISTPSYSLGSSGSSSGYSGSDSRSSSSNTTSSYGGW